MRSRVLPLLLLTCSGPALAVESPTPAPLPIDRYEQMLDQSPFALATPQAEPPPAPKDNWANNYVLAALGKNVPDANGAPQWLVTVESRDKRERFELLGNEEKDGFSVASVDWSPIPRKSTVILKKGNEPGKLEMLQEEAPPPPQAPASGGIARPGQPGGVVIPGAQPPALGGNRVPGANNGRIPLPRPNNFPNAAVPNGPVPRPGAPPPVVPTAQPVVPGGAVPQAMPAPGVTAYPNPGVPANGAQPGAAPPQPRRVRVINTQ